MKKGGIRTMPRKPKKLKPPVWLDEIASEEWKRVEKLLREDENKDFTLKDIKALEAYCTNYSKWKQAEQILIKDGLTFRCDSGYVQQRAEVSIANNAQKEFRAWAGELGLTPKARVKMNKIVAAKGDVDEEMERYIDK